jgi:hypothetical protein
MENEDYVDPEKMGWIRTIKLEEYSMCSITVGELVYRLQSKDHCIYHREDGPARTVIYGDDNFTQEWFLWGEKHRVDGPAVIRDISSRMYRYEWWIKGVRLSTEKEKLLNICYETYLSKS